MSEAQLVKIQQECAKLEEEVAAHKAAEPLAAACEQIVNQILKNPDPFCSNKGGAPNPWHTNTSTDGGCCVIS